ncbi:hypothetical protein COCVIDRAFT_113048, partial [Bipolaris victoriae FI3]
RSAAVRQKRLWRREDAPVVTRNPASADCRTSRIGTRKKDSWLTDGCSGCCRATVVTSMSTERGWAGEFNTHGQPCS